MKADCHFITFDMDSTPESGIDHKALCGKLIEKAVWIATEGDIASLDDFVGKIGGRCDKCEVVLRGMKQLERFRIYGAVSRDIYDDMVRLRRIAV